MTTFRWRRLQPDQVEHLDREPVDATTLAVAAEIVEMVKAEGETGLRHYAERFGDREPDDPLVLGREEMAAAKDRLPASQVELLGRTADRIRMFAEVQLATSSNVDVPVPGGVAGHQLAPVRRAGCYAPGGRFPLPSSVLMTAVTARAAGVADVWVASPRPSDVTLAAADVAGADAILAVGGAHAIAAMAYGAGPVPACDVVVGPGNRWVTAAKKLVAGRVGIDMLAGPSELVVLADSTADPATAAADLLAQAEHDSDALPVLVTTSSDLADAVEAELGRQLTTLPTRDVAAAALDNGFAVVADSLDAAVDVCDRLAPEHLQLVTADLDRIAARLQHWGGLFLGEISAEVFGDYGAGPNHTLPTGGVARFKGGLSVFDFVRVRTWLELDDSEAAAELARDAADLARLEGLEGHARAAEMRLGRREVGK
jgi:phosphoribosyl-ATP pyrophosphohydrolase/phosphoribosyl-AMP cyclohydrolase/histidinol dehydrogenase